jgi:23S rRNA-/tRNA-specific pseudouridylate synthase
MFLIPPIGKMRGALVFSAVIQLGLLLTSVYGFGIFFSLHQRLSCYSPVACDGLKARGRCALIDEHNHRHRGDIRTYTLLYSLAFDEEHSARVPQNEIDAQALLSQVSNLLTLKDLKNVLRSSNSSTSGRKAQLIDEIGAMLNVTPETVQIKEDTNTYKRLTVKELREDLRQRGAKVSGRKTELAQRLMDLDGLEWSSDPSQTKNEDWSVLEPTISYAHSNEVSQQYIRSEELMLELPISSTLLFVDKPSGMSNLPTRELQETNGDVTTDSTPIYPCLSDSVKQWLLNHPDGIKRMEQAKNDEEQYWNSLIQSISVKNDKNAQKLSKKKQRQREKLIEKLPSFEPRPVHRLDIDTSGVVCIALTPYALRTSGMLFEQKSRDSSESEAVESDSPHSVEKRYVALVEGIISTKKQEEATVSHSIGKIWVPDSPQNASSTAGHHEWACDILNNESIAFCRPGDASRTDPLKFVKGSVRDALTSYQVIELCLNNTSKIDFTRVELTPHTGRGHQLRLHMASLDHPIVGELDCIFCSVLQRLCMQF